MAEQQTNSEKAEKEVSILDQLASEAVPNPGKKELSALFAKYGEAEKEVAEAEKAKIDAQEARSEAVKAIVQYAGKGPFSYKGEMLVPMTNKSKKLYFRGPNHGRDVIKVG